ncbi:BolA/IbaG family iron-sulfur metabolism protein [Legionella israelensis]|uniref:BolA like protein n=1 Tax=Legionella israelensis TaxID=454 RepID=A0A0W0WHX0_9GAMM|nr:BolA/IbaG family iron-sulfur metabolism protein [Legionella israelensis]KTD31948.1 BolA like protein [Legionella israelensis]QBR83853.1 BolA/IbaG family iron-sulfur metabolism protein [Legionella israelensis]QBS10733.1 BolA/IbaG family iron-sulfur metabolism protein [Legionella israelensis]QDP73051.1 BolA/IbaG family iron-sulfur metabolism protein [Legionella israelensis]SCY28485.1 Acid stress-induced BolA-like protein IbaG/YrbA, predicted regulator of iron metabolism [Legionella israelensi
MLSNEELENQLNKLDEVHKAIVEGDGYHYHLTIISNAFVGKSRVARQQWVYAQLKDYITTGSLHAISMKTLTEEEWREQHG